MTEAVHKTELANPSKVCVSATSGVCYFSNLDTTSRVGNYRYPLVVEWSSEVNWREFSVEFNQRGDYNLNKINKLVKRVK
jgi:hypothetical protein